MTAPAKPIKGPAAHTPEWNQMRLFDPNRKGREVVIGASEAAVACGVSPYMSRLELYLIKRGEKDGPDENEAMKAGKRFEPVVLDWYAETTGKKLRRDLPMYFHPELPYLAATPDAEEISKPKGVDSKVSGEHMYDSSGEDENKYGEEGTDQLPLSYIFQGQQQCAVMGYESVDFPVMFSPRKLRTYTVARDDHLIGVLTKSIAELVELIAIGEPPEPDFRHSSTGKLLFEMMEFTPEAVCELDHKAANDWAEYQRLGSRIKELQADRRECRNKVLFAMGDSAIAFLPRGQKQIKRVQVGESLYTAEDARKALANVGKTKRRAYQRLSESKRK